MIVKNEAAVIERCLASVKPHIHAWAISDTGSSDGTQDIVRRFMSGLPGQLIERPWVNFSTNRNEALELAKRYGDYALIVDADDRISGSGFGELDADLYDMTVEFGPLVYKQPHLVRLDRDFFYTGATHEYLDCKTAFSRATADGMVYIIGEDGARRSSGNKYRDDAAILEKALLAEPDNARHRFYLAQSYRDAGQPDDALANYEKRVAMGGWGEEVYYSKFQIAVLRERTGAAYADTVAAYLDAYDFRPTRAEAPCELARYCRLQHRYAVAREFARIAMTLPISEDVLFIDGTVSQWRARDEFAVASYWCGDYERSAELCRELLADPRLPAGERARVQRNLEFCLPHLEKAQR